MIFFNTFESKSHIYMIIKKILERRYFFQQSELFYHNLKIVKK